MERMYLVWWGLLVGVGVVGIVRLLMVLTSDKRISSRVVLLISSLVLLAGAVLVCPVMLTLDYNGLSCTQARLGISFMLQTAALATLVVSFRSGGSQRARRYLDSHKKADS